MTPDIRPDIREVKGSGTVRDIAEMVMRFTPATIALAAVMTMVSSVGISQRPDSQISPLSLQWQAKGDAARAAGNLEAANDAFETALAVDPRNRGAFIALGDVARQQQLQGKAVRFYKNALALDPADMTALAGTVNALVDRGALANARETLSRMKTLCRTDCGEVAKLNTLIDNKAIAQAQTTPPGPEAKADTRQP